MSLKILRDVHYQTPNEIFYDLTGPIISRQSPLDTFIAHQSALLAKLSDRFSITEDERQLFFLVWQNKLLQLPKTRDVRFGLMVTEIPREPPDSTLFNAKPFIACNHTFQERIANLVNFGFF